MVSLLTVGPSFGKPSSTLTRPRKVTVMRVCVYCDRGVEGVVCPTCHEYKGLMAVEEWEDYTGEVWEG